MNLKLEFFSNCLSSPREVAAIAPSSKHLIKRILRHAALEDARCLVEYGPGVGTVTHALLEKLSPDGRLLCFETNLKFCSLIKENIKDDRLVVINDSAENLAYHLKRLGIGSIDYAFSGIPFSLIGAKNKKEIIKTTRDKLRERGKFVVYQQYSMMARKYLRTYFEATLTELELRNIPPSYVFVCEKT